MKHTSCFKIVPNILGNISTVTVPSVVFSSNPWCVCEAEPWSARAEWRCWRTASGGRCVTTAGTSAPPPWCVESSASAAPRRPWPAPDWDKVRLHQSHSNTCDDASHSQNPPVCTRPCTTFSTSNIPSCANIHIVFGPLLAHLSQRRPEVSMWLHLGMYTAAHSCLCLGPKSGSVKSNTPRRQENHMCFGSGTRTAVGSAAKHRGCTKCSGKKKKKERGLFNGFQRWNLLLERVQKVIWGDCWVQLRHNKQMWNGSFNVFWSHWHEYIYAPAV